MPFRCSTGAAHPPPPRPLPCLHSSSLQFHAYIVSFTPAQSSLAQRAPGVPPPEINVLNWNVSASRLEPEACQSRPLCPLRGASAMVGGLGGRGKGGNSVLRLPWGRDSLPPPHSFTFTVYKNKPSSLTPQRSRSGAHKIFRVLPILPPLKKKKPTREGA